MEKKNSQNDSSKNLEDYWISSVGKTLYGKFVDGYSKKMWQIDDNKEIDYFSWSPKGVALKEGKREAWDEAISAYDRGSQLKDYCEKKLQEAKMKVDTIQASDNIATIPEKLSPFKPD